MSNKKPLQVLLLQGFVLSGQSRDRTGDLRIFSPSKTDSLHIHHCRLTFSSLHLKQIQIPPSSAEIRLNFSHWLYIGCTSFTANVGCIDRYIGIFS